MWWRERTRPTRPGAFPGAPQAGAYHDGQKAKLEASLGVSMPAGVSAEGSASIPEGICPATTTQEAEPYHARRSEGQHGCRTLGAPPRNSAGRFAYKSWVQ